MARIPGIDTVFGGVQSLLQVQTEALAALPGTVTSLTAAVRGLAETVQRTNAMLARLDGIVAELEEPLRALAPGLAKVAVLLEDPVVEELPETLRQMQADVLPVLKTLADTHERVAFLAGSTERLMGLPGAALLGRRRTPPRTDAPGEPVVVVPD